MEKLIDLISKEVKEAFEKAGYESSYGTVTVSNRPDLCEYQCNGAMAVAKQYHKAPIQIASEVADNLNDNAVIDSAQAVNPGFLNINIRGGFLAGYLKDMSQCADGRFGLDDIGRGRKVVVDYGGPNAAKALHVGHLRSAVIGEAVKRIFNYAGYDAIGDIHMGDWGLQMGLVITELKERFPDLPYFADSFEGEYPKEAPITIEELGEIYPTAAGKAKVDPAYKDKAMEATLKLQNGQRGYRALWKQIMDISVANMKKIYDSLDVHFELWKGESDVQDIIPGMVSYLKDGGYAHMSEGALVIDVKEDTDTKEMPPCIVIKSDGASLYNTTDLATIMERTEKIDPVCMVYLTDKRQDLYFEQVFRASRKSKLVKPDTELVHIGFGTVNGKDGKPFKTRDGGVMPLEMLIKDINDRMYERILENRDIDPDEAKSISNTVSLAAIKYGDLSNQASKDYIFDVDKFTSSEGNTGPYILYTMVRIRSILAKYTEQGGSVPVLPSSDMEFIAPKSASQKALMLALSGFAPVIEGACAEVAPHRICAYIYSLANAFNGFYHDTKILACEDDKEKSGYIAILVLTLKILEACIKMLGFDAPSRM
ncbi:MAG: arginine--tRNA ligase [Lachnospiraceae bacterium]|nr:arginine--tRNA ligase [Lachnospiraceae bacterium]